MATTVIYYPERENRRASRSFLFAKGKVTIDQGENIIDDELALDFINSVTVQELVSLDAIKIVTDVVNKPEVLKKVAKPLILDDDIDDDIDEE